MGEIAETYEAMRNLRREQRKIDLANNTKSVVNAGLQFTSHNNDQHLVITRGKCIIDYWPGTDKWTMRNVRKSSYGCKNLIKYLFSQPR